MVKAGVGEAVAVASTREGAIRRKVSSNFIPTTPTATTAMAMKSGMIDVGLPDDRMLGGGRRGTTGVRAGFGAGLS